MVRKVLKRLAGPTPAKWVKIGHAVSTLGSLITGQQIWAGNHKAATAALILTWLGGLIVNLATPDDNDGKKL